MDCVICADPLRPVEPGWLVCSRDYWRLSNALRAIPDLVAEIQSLGYVQRDYRGSHGFAAVDKDGARLPHFDQIAHALPAGPVNGRTSAPRVSGSNGRPLPIRVDPTDLTAPVRPGSLAVHATGDWPADQIGWLSVATELDFWAGDWATARNESRPSPQVPLLCGWLVDRLDWATSDHQAGTVALEEFAAKVSSLYGALMAAVGGWEPRPETLTAPCRSCGTLALYRQIGPRPEFDRVACGACPSLLTESEYGEYVRGLYEAEVARRRTPVELFLIWSNQHGMWWRPSRRGYTMYIEEAGRYDGDEAREIVRSATLDGQLVHRRTDPIRGVAYDSLDEVLVPAPVAPLVAYLPAAASQPEEAA